MSYHTVWQGKLSRTDGACSIRKAWYLLHPEKITCSSVAIHPLQRSAGSKIRVAQRKGSGGWGAKSPELAEGSGSSVNCEFIYSVIARNEAI
jgi:hypothetical protein